MRQSTRVRYENEILAGLCISYGITNPSVQFEATIPVAIKLNQAIQDAIDFLQMINILPVTDMYGDVLRMAVPEPLASRTNTNDPEKERKPVLAVDPLENKYTCVQTNYDAGVKYGTMDIWARFKNFVALYQSGIFRRIGLDRMMVGFHGTHAAKDTDRKAFPNLEDVNIGWYKLLEERNPKHFIKEGKIKPGKIIIGTNGDYKNLDQLVYDLWKAIPIAHRTEKHVAIIGDALITDDTEKSLGSFAQRPTEKAAMQVLERKYGGRTPIVVPTFPDTGLMLTNLKNLHIYYQESAVRRRTEDQPKHDRVVNYMSSNDAYAIEDYEGIIAVDPKAIEITDNPAADRVQIQVTDLKSKK